MNKITIIKECIKAYNRENTIKGNVVSINPMDYKEIKNLDGSKLVIDNFLIVSNRLERPNNVSVGYKPELILN